MTHDGALTVGSLFSGIGGLELGLERAGMRVVWQVEADEYARTVLWKHWPLVPKHTDVRAVGAANLQPVDVICGGFPCQDLSYAGKGAGIDGARSGLGSEFARLIRELRPRYVVVENVPALLTRGMGRVLGDLAACGYDAEWDCISASAAGAPHRRDRVFIVATDAERDSLRQQSERHQPHATKRRHAIALDNGADGPMAHPSGSGRQSRQRDVHAGESDVAGSGADVADAAGAQHITGESGESGPVRDKARWAEPERRSWWDIEPDVGFRSDGIPPVLDGGLNANAEESRSGTPVREMRSGVGTQADQRPIGGPRRVPSPSLLWPRVHGERLCQRHAILSGCVSPTGTAPPWDSLRVMWGYDQAASASRRREAREQCAREHPDLMRELSRYAPPPCPTCWADGSWEDGIMRVAHGVPNRVDRLRCLGNAVVPAVAEHIGRMITGHSRDS